MYEPLSTLYTSGIRSVIGSSCSKTVLLLEPSSFYNSGYERGNGWHYQPLDRPKILFCILYTILWIHIQISLLYFSWLLTFYGGGVHFIAFIQFFLKWPYEGISIIIIYRTIEKVFRDTICLKYKDIAVVNRARLGWRRGGCKFLRMCSRLFTQLVQQYFIQTF